MNKEEKEAIEEAKKQIEEVHNLNELNIFMTDSTTLKIILNLIDKLQEIIKKQSYTNKKLRNKIKTVRKERNKLQKENKESKELYDKLFNGYNKLVQEHLELEKTIDLIIDDFQMENYFVGMTNKEVREYYKKRKELKE